MGYTHYWYRKDKEIGTEIFEKLTKDFQKLIASLEELGIALAGGDGCGKPLAGGNLIWFNGVQRCGHPASYELGIAWPSENAGGLANPWKEDVRSKPWFAGATIDKRVCSGDCSHETCHFPRILEGKADYHPAEEHGSGWYFDFCKTAYKPYDLAVTSFLIAAKHYLEEKICIKSDGQTQHWADARILCSGVLGYGFDFELDS